MAVPYRVLTARQPNPVRPRSRSVGRCPALWSHLPMRHEPTAHKAEPKVREGGKGPEEGPREERGIRAPVQ